VRNPGKSLLRNVAKRPRKRSLSGRRARREAAKEDPVRVGQMLAHQLALRHQPHQVPAALLHRLYPPQPNQRKMATLLILGDPALTSANLKKQWRQKRDHRSNNNG
jgi:hypothetical protein